MYAYKKTTASLLSLVAGTRWLCVCVVSLWLAFVGSTGLTYAGTATLDWVANTESDLAGYKLYQSTIPGQYGAPVATVGLVTSHVLTLTPTVDTTYYFTLTAYDTSGNESAKSNEVSKLIAGLPIVQKPGAPILRVTGRTTTTITIAYDPVPDGAGGIARVGIRRSLPPIQWGAAQEVDCVASPCTITGLTPGLVQEFMGVAWRGEANVNAIFGPLSAVVTASTLPIDVPPIPPAGLRITQATQTEIIIVASLADCPNGVSTSTKGSTVAQAKRTVLCLR